MVNPPKGLEQPSRNIAQKNKNNFFNPLTKYDNMSLTHGRGFDFRIIVRHFQPILDHWQWGNSGNFLGTLWAKIGQKLLSLSQWCQK